MSSEVLRYSLAREGGSQWFMPTSVHGWLPYCMWVSLRPHPGRDTEVELRCNPSQWPQSHAINFQKARLRRSFAASNFPMQH